MSVTNGELANENTFNTSFMSRETDTDTVGILSLLNTSPASLAQISNLQKYVNQIASTSGITGEDDATRLQYGSENYIADGDTRKEAIGKLDVSLKALSDVVDLGSKKFISFATDTEYTDEYGAPSGGESYYNTTTGLVRYYDAVAAEWKPVGSRIVGIQERLGTGDGLTVDFSLTNAPLSDASIIVTINGRMIEASEYSVTLPNVTFNTAPEDGQVVYVWYLSEGTPAAPIVAAGTQQVLYRTITSGEITAKSLTLPVAPSDVTKVKADFVDVVGPSLGYGTAFNVSGTTFNWNGLLLDGFIEAGDKLRISYFS